MNGLTVIQATQGVCSYYLQTIPDFASKGVVIGRDHRHNSDEFAKLTAAAFISRNVKVFYYKDLVHTPMVPFAVTLLGAACGIMITASHNPKNDNGYKLYGPNGCQIVSPHDKLISEHILNNLQPWLWDESIVDTHPLVSDPTPRVSLEYFDSLRKLSLFNKDGNNLQNVRFCYTAMHGVGLKPASEAFRVFGLHDFVQVPQQVNPDPDFPTVAYPNPEEGKGALGLAMACADTHNCRIILANDPDADRLAIAEKQPDGSWYIFNGNEIGIVLASFMLLFAKHHNRTAKLAMVSTVVSSHMLKQMALKEGFFFTETLTGFKWIGNRAIELHEKHGYDVVFGYEEAIGFMVGDAVRDKDGVSALAVFAEWSNHLAKDGISIYAHLTSLYDKYGYFVSNNGYFICHDSALIKSMFDDIRYGIGSNQTVLSYPKSIGGSDIVWIRDLTVGYDNREPDNKPSLPVSSSSQMLTFEMDNGALVTLRTSGTEPKIKYYTEFRGSSLETAKQELQLVVDDMKSLFFSKLSP